MDDTTIDIMRMCAFRYALGRSSYVTGAVSRELIRVCMDMGSIERSKYIEEVLDTPPSRMGQQMDAIGWVDMIKHMDVDYQYTGSIACKYDEVYTYHDKETIR